MPIGEILLTAQSAARALKVVEEGFTSVRALCEGEGLNEERGKTSPPLRTMVRR